MVDKRNKNRSFIVSSLITLAVIAMLIASVPAGAVTVSISGLSGSITQGTPKTFLVTVTIDSPDKFVPVSNITLSINGPTTKQWTFNPTNGMLIEPDDKNITIKVISSPKTEHFGYGYGYGVDSVGYGYGYDFGYGYGYGYNSGQGGRPISFTYEITLSTTDLTAGDYTATAYLNTGNPAKASFASTDTLFTIVPRSTQDKGSISGFKFNDINGNGTWDPVEPGLANWTIVLTVPDGSNITAVTNEDGLYRFSNLSAGNYTIEEVLQPGWIRTFPPNPIRSITLSAGENVTDVDFGNMLVTVNGSISGFKINAANGMGLQDWTIRLIGIVGKGAETRVIRMNTTTNADGSYVFDDLPAGRYILREELQRGFGPVGPPVKHIMLTLGENSMNNNFTNRPR